MVLPTSGSISISDINSCARFTNGNMGINTTSPNYNLDVNGTLQATTITTSNILATTSVSSGAVNATNSTVTNAVSTNISSGTLNLSTGITSASAQITNSNVTTETIGTARITGSLIALGSSNTVGNIFTTGGSVGIGTTSPATDNGSRLSVVGSAFDANSGIIRLYPATFGQKACIGFVSGQTGGSFWTLGRQNISNEFALTLSTNTAGMYFFANGNVSCGPLITTSLTTTNIVSTNISSGTLNLTTGITSASAQITNSNVTTQTIGTTRITDSLLALGNSNTVGNIFTTGGNIGIGTTSPSTRLNVVHNDYGGIRLEGSNSDVNISVKNTGTGGREYLIGSASGVSQGGQGNFYVYDFTASAFRMTISTAGNVGIGTVNPAVPLHVVYSGSGNGKLRLQHVDAGSKWWNLGPDNSSNNITVYNHNNNGVWIANDGSSWNATSDIRVKKDVETLTSGLDLIEQLRPVKYRYNKDDAEKPHRIGFIAQEVRDVLPEVVSANPTDDFPDGLLGLSMESMVPYLVNAIKNLSTELKNVNQRMDQMQS